MSKLYKCENCGNIKEISDKKAPICCGCKMVEEESEIEKLFSCSCCKGCDADCKK